MLAHHFEGLGSVCHLEHAGDIQTRLAQRPLDNFAHYRGAVDDQSRDFTHRDFPLGAYRQKTGEL